MYNKFYKVIPILLFVLIGYNKQVVSSEIYSTSNVNPSSSFSFSEDILREYLDENWDKLEEAYNQGLELEKIGKNDEAYEKFMFAACGPDELGLIALIRKEEKIFVERLYDVPIKELWAVLNEEIKNFDFDKILHLILKKEASYEIGISLFRKKPDDITTMLKAIFWFVIFDGEKKERWRPCNWSNAESCIDKLIYRIKKLKGE